MLLYYCVSVLFFLTDPDQAYIKTWQCVLSVLLLENVVGADFSVITGITCKQLLTFLCIQFSIAFSSLVQLSDGRLAIFLTNNKLETNDVPSADAQVA